MSDLFLGLDLGTSGARCIVLDEAARPVVEARAPMPPAPSGVADAEDWWRAAAAALAGASRALGEARTCAIRAAAIDATSGSMVLVDGGVRPVGPGLLYASAGFEAEAAAIARHAPPGDPGRGPASAPARMLRLQSLDQGGRARHLCHQADFVLARLMDRAGLSDDCNALKLGHDPESRHWPDWFAAAGIRTALLPEVRPVGARMGRLASGPAAALGLPAGLALLAGATDSVAAYLASGASEMGEAVTSLGTTLAIKLLSDRRVEDPARGVYSHRLGGLWLAGGASNTGGGVLARHFDDTAIAALSARMDPARDSGLRYRPLPGPGERFPIADPGLEPILEPRPADDALFLQGMLEGIARIEAAGYAALAGLGAPEPTRILSVGGGARNVAWGAIRARILRRPVLVAPHGEAAHGMAILARRASA